MTCPLLTSYRVERFKCRQLDHSSIKLLCSILLFKNIYLLNPHKNLMKWILSQFSSVQFSRSVVSDYLWPHEPQHARPPCPSPTPGVHPNPHPLCQWCQPTLSSSVVPFFSWPQSFPPSGSFQTSQVSISGSQSIGVSASTSVLPMNTQDWSPCSPRDSQEIFPNTTVQKYQFLGTQLSL